MNTKLVFSSNEALDNSQYIIIDQYISKSRVLKVKGPRVARESRGLATLGLATLGLATLGLATLGLDCASESTNSVHTNALQYFKYALEVNKEVSKTFLQVKIRT